MAVKDDSESSTEEGDNRIVGHCKPFTKGKGNRVPREERTKYKGGKDVNLGGKSSWQKGNGKTGGERTEKRRQRPEQNTLDLWQKQDTLQLRVQKAATRTCTQWVRRKVKSLKRRERK